MERETEGELVCLCVYLCASVRVFVFLLCVKGDRASAQQSGQVHVHLQACVCACDANKRLNGDKRKDNASSKAHAMIRLSPAPK